MKKLILLLLSFLIIGTPCFAEYKPIPKELKKQYKMEMESIIDTQYPIAVYKTEQIRKKAHDMYLKVLKNKDLYIYYATSNYDTNIDIGEFDLLVKLIDVTNKYIKANKNTLATDYTGALFDYLNTYFEDNDINTDKLRALDILVNKKYKEIEQEQQALYRFIYPEEY